MAEGKYFGHFSERDDVAREFAMCADRYEEPIRIVEGFPADDEILFAAYETPSYYGSAFVLFERDGKLFEVHGSHCSCMGLEGQWEPEETTWAALAMRPRDDWAIRYSCDDAGIAQFWRLVDEHKPRDEGQGSAR